MEITWHTKISDLVNVEEVISIVSDARSKIEKTINDRVDTLELEMTVGGLSQQALMLDDNSPLFNASKKVVEMYDKQISDVKELENEVKEKATEKRKEELETLETKVKNKLESFKNELEEKKKLSEKNPSSQSNAAASGSSLQSNVAVISYYSSQIKILEKKLEKINAELGKL